MTKNAWLKALLRKKEDCSPLESQFHTSSNSSAPILVTPQREETVVIGRTSPIPIKPAERPYWDEQGWNIIIGNEETRLIGNYHVFNKLTGKQEVFSGIVVLKRSRANPYILRPPIQTRLHPKWPCFRRVIDDWFRIEWFRAANHPDEAILYVESILYEVINGITKKPNSRRR